jgi:hypothetical protein
MFVALSLLLQDAEENLGETEVRGGLHAKAAVLNPESCYVFVSDLAGR